MKGNKNNVNISTRTLDIRVRHRSTAPVQFDWIAEEQVSQAALLRGGSSVSAQKAGVGHWNFPDFGSKPFQGRSPSKREPAEIADGAIGP